MKRQIFVTCCLLFITIGDAVGQWGKVDPAEIEKMMQLPQDDWLNLTLMGTKIGYAHIYMEKSRYEEEAAIRVRTDMVMDLKRTGTGLRLTTTRISYVGMDLVPRYFITTSNETGQEKHVEGRIKNNVAYLETSLAGKTTYSEIPISADTIFEGMISYFLLQRSIQVGDEHTLPVFNLDLMQPVKTGISVLREDQIEFNGKMDAGLCRQLYDGHYGRTHDDSVARTQWHNVSDGGRVDGTKHGLGEDRYANGTRRIRRS